MRVRILWVLLPLLLAGCSGDASRTDDGNVIENIKVQTHLPEKPTLDPEAAALARRYTGMFYDYELDALYEEFSSEMQERGMSKIQLATLRDYVQDNYGNETELIAEESATKDDYRAVVRWARFELTDDVIQLKWYLRDDDSIAGFFIGPAKRPETTGGG